VQTFDVAELQREASVGSSITPQHSPCISPTAGSAPGSPPLSAFGSRTLSSLAPFGSRSMASHNLDTDAETPMAPVPSSTGNVDGIVALVTLQLDKLQGPMAMNDVADMGDSHGSDSRPLSTVRTLSTVRRAYLRVHKRFSSC
jgi:hypothetical protein